MSLVVSLTSSGSNINDVIDNGVLKNGEENIVRYFIRNTFLEPIIGVKVFFMPIDEETQTYEGDFTPEDDFNKFKEWGDNTTDCGIIVNFDPVDSDWRQLKTGVMDDITTGILLPTTTGIANEGVLAPNEAEEAEILVKIKVPADEDIVGDREFNLVFFYYKEV